MTLKVSELTVQRGSRVLASGISFEIPAGTLVGITGPNGTGKSSLLAQLVGALPIRHGHVEFPEMEMPFILIEQSWNTALGFTVREVLEWSTASTTTVEEVANLTAISSLLDQDVRTLSGGERARVGFARALASRAPIVLLDEPTAHMDRDTAGLIQRLIRELIQQKRSVLVVSHDENLLSECHEVLNLGPTT